MVVVVWERLAVRLVVANVFAPWFVLYSFEARFLQNPQDFRSCGQVVASLLVILDDEAVHRRKRVASLHA